jgi:hypothetical protein
MPTSTGIALATERKLTARWRLTIPTMTGITIVMERKLLVIDDAYAEWCRSRHGKQVDPLVSSTSGQGLAGTLRSRCSMGKAHEQDLRRPRYHVDHTREEYLPRYDQRVGHPSMPTSRRHCCRLLRPYRGTRFDCRQDRQVLAVNFH